MQLWPVGWVSCGRGFFRDSLINVWPVRVTLKLPRMLCVRLLYSVIWTVLCYLSSCQGWQSAIIHRARAPGWPADMPHTRLMQFPPAASDKCRSIIIESNRSTWALFEGFAAVKDDKANWWNEESRWFLRLSRWKSSLLEWKL